MKFFPVAFLGLLFLLSLQNNAGLRPYTPVCDRTPQVRDTITAQLGMPCDHVQAQDLRKITYLDLSFQNITNLHLGDFDGLDSLETLRLEYNRLKEIIQGLFLPTPNLKELILDGNTIARLSSKSLEGLQNSLQKLSVKENGLELLVLEAFFVLKYLDASSNRLGGAGLDFFLAELPELKDLYLEHNQLQSVNIDDLLLGVSKLDNLNLSFNQLQTVIDFRKRFSRLRVLNLSSNQIRDVPEGLLFSGVELLRLDDNQIFSLPGKIPEGAKSVKIKLKYLSLFGNPITRLPKWLKKRERALQLTLDYNRWADRCGLAMAQLFLGP